MGKVRTILIKNVSKELINKYPNVFTTNFEQNKKLLDKTLLAKSGVPLQENQWIDLKVEGEGGAIKL